ncbi:hypothetical protein Bbelb_427670 [Branchiostoma belcheri]|nr:hypothetical protein Bbelb_427670 [Branchiostoma belcheri]
MAQRPRRYEPTWPTGRENSPSRLPADGPASAAATGSASPAAEGPSSDSLPGPATARRPMSANGGSAPGTTIGCTTCTMEEVGKEVKATPGTRKDRCEEEDGGGAETSHFHPISIPIPNIKGPARRVFGVFFGTTERDLNGDRRASRRLPAYFRPRAGTRSVTWVGIEPGTSRSRAERATDCATRPRVFFSYQCQKTYMSPSGSRQEPARDLTAARPNCKSRSAPYHTPHGSRRATDRAPDGSLTETGRKIRRTLGVMTPVGVYAEDMPNGRRFKN